MTQPAPAKQRWLKRQYHWVILVVVFLQYFISAGLMNNLYSLFLIPVTNELNISRSAFSLSTIINCIPAFFSNLLFGVCYFRYGYRKLAVVALIHDVEWHESDLSREKFTESNERFKQNGYKVAKSQFA